MLQLIHAISNVQLGLGVVQGLLAAAKAGNGNELKVTIDKGIARVGSKDGDTLANKALEGLNQPGMPLEFAGGDVTVTAGQKSYVWLKTDGTLEATDWADDPNSVAPEYGPDPHKGAMLKYDSQAGPLRRPEAASVLLCEVTADANQVTAVSNLVRTMVVI